MTGAYSASPCWRANSPLAGREPGNDNGSFRHFEGGGPPQLSALGAGQTAAKILSVSRQARALRRAAGCIPRKCRSRRPRTRRPQLLRAVRPQARERRRSGLPPKDARACQSVRSYPRGRGSHQGPAIYIGTGVDVHRGHAHDTRCHVGAVPDGGPARHHADGVRNRELL